MNKVGAGLGLAIMVSIFVLLVGFLFLGFLIDEVDNTKTNLSCSSPTTISDGTKLLCLSVSFMTTYWIWLVIALAISIITVRFVL